MQSIDLGTKALIFPQPPYVPGYRQPERIWLSPPAGSVKAGPSDDQFHVVRPRFPKEPYSFPDLPPFNGHTLPPIETGPGGHLDDIRPDDPDFPAVHCYTCARHTLDIWQSYLRGRIPWHFEAHLPKLEIIPYVEWRNAQSGYGFLELGRDVDPDGRVSPYALNYDVIAHEMGHFVLFSLMGVPDNWQSAPVFRIWHESFADLVALLGLLHFDTAIDRLLRRTRGELWLRNELNRIAELVDERQIRLASNPHRLSNASHTVHDQSRPITGALFDWLIDIHLDQLVVDGAVEASLVRRIRGRHDFNDDEADDVSDAIGRRFERAPFAFRAALQQARDVVGRTIAVACRDMQAERLDLGYLADALLNAASHTTTATRVDRLEHLLTRRDFPPGIHRRIHSHDFTTKHID